MRPIKLTISAFGPFASKQVIDFEELKGRNIFVISGKTGAGKTTIFDAISYALYGEASGDSRNTDSLRSHFADDDTETYVELEFEVRGERYIVNRVPKQNKKRARGEGYIEKNADATLILPDGKVITKVKNVTDKIIEILGITREQFKQIVMLAQGEFKKLLLADSSEREGIFRKIFNTYDFEKIQIEFKKKADLLNANRSKCKDEVYINLKNIKGTHEIQIDDYIDFDFIISRLTEFVEEDMTIYKKVSEESKEVEELFQLKNQEKATIDTNNKQVKERETLSARLDELLSQEPTYQEKELEIANIKNAKEIVYIEDALTESNTKLSKKETEYTSSLENLNKLKVEQLEVNELFKIEESKEAERDKLSIDINNLKKLESKIIELEIINDNINKLNINLENINCEIDTNKKEVMQLKKEKEDTKKSLKEKGNLEAKKIELENAILSENKYIEDISKLLEVITEHSDKTKEWIEFDRKYKEVKDKYEKMDELYKKEQAGILALTLRENEECPVCGSKHHPNKAIINKDFKIPTLEELKIVKQDSEETERENQKKINKLIDLKASINKYLEQINDNQIILSNPLNDNEPFHSKTVEIINDRFNTHSRLKIKLENDLVELKKQIDFKNELEKTLINLSNSIIKKEEELLKLEAGQQKYSLELNTNTTKSKEYIKEIPNDIEDIETLKELIECKIIELDNSKLKFKELSSKKEDLLKKIEGEDSTSKEILKSINELKVDIQNNENKFNNSIEKYKFSSIDAYTEAKSKINNLNILENEVEQYNSELKINKAKYEDIVTKTKDISFIDITELELEIKRIQDKKVQIEERLRELHSIIDNNKTILNNIKVINIDFKEIEDEYKIVGELSELANGKKSPYISFERYILASYFEDIIEAANIRLEKMTGDRFSLIRKITKSKGAGQKGLELEIYDNYTDSSRDVSSLSGGESFKASLALALGLSDIVQSNAGGVSLDTMFVDEGFGTLDPQSLDNAIDSLLELQRGGRLVGIISHVEELKQRIDAKLEVTSTTKGSVAEFNI